MTAGFFWGDLILAYFIKKIFQVNAHSKLRQQWFWPFRVLKRLGSNAYLLELPYDMLTSQVFDIADLFPFHGDPPETAEMTLPPCNGTKEERGFNWGCSGHRDCTYQTQWASEVLSEVVGTTFDRLFMSWRGWIKAQTRGHFLENHRRFLARRQVLPNRGRANVDEVAK